MTDQIVSLIKLARQHWTESHFNKKRKKRLRLNFTRELRSVY